MSQKYKPSTNCSCGAKDCGSSSICDATPLVYADTLGCASYKIAFIERRIVEDKCGHQSSLCLPREMTLDEFQKFIDINGDKWVVKITDENGDGIYDGELSNGDNVADILDLSDIISRIQSNEDDIVSINGQIVNINARLDALEANNSPKIFHLINRPLLLSLPNYISTSFTQNVVINNVVFGLPAECNSYMIHVDIGGNTDNTGYNQSSITYSGVTRGGAASNSGEGVQASGTGTGSLGHSYEAIVPNEFSINFDSSINSDFLPINVHISAAYISEIIT